MFTSWTKLTRRKMGLLAVAVCTTALFVAAGAASADDGDCTTGSSSGNVNTCVNIVGGGLLVNNITASAHVVDSTRTLQVCIHGPAAALPLCTDFEQVPPGSTLIKQWFPNADEPAGSYCARTWRENADGSHTLIGEACAPVTP